jgi:hypothetical protein
VDCALDEPRESTEPSAFAQVGVWTLRAHKSYVIGVHYEGNDIVTRAVSQASPASTWSSSSCATCAPEGQRRRRRDRRRARRIAVTAVELGGRRAPGRGLVGGPGRAAASCAGTSRASPAST